MLTATVDIDALALYRQIHGLAPADSTGALDPAWELGVPRFLELFASFGITGTFFVVTKDLAHPGARARAREILAAGHELASHSHTHLYRLVREPFERQRDELHRADQALRALTGEPVSGYRAPGYNQHPALQAELVRLGYRYDASAFPCPAYLLAKGALIAFKRLRGHRSHSIVTRPWEALGPRLPHRLTTPAGPLWQLPISVLTPLRFPLVGTALFALGERGVSLLGPLLERETLLHPEFHAADLLALDDDGLAPELAVQPDLRMALDTKKAILRTFLADCRRGGRPSAPLRHL